MTHLGPRGLKMDHIGCLDERGDGCESGAARSQIASMSKKVGIINPYPGADVRNRDLAGTE